MCATSSKFVPSGAATVFLLPSLNTNVTSKSGPFSSKNVNPRADCLLKPSWNCFGSTDLGRLGILCQTVAIEV